MTRRAALVPALALLAVLAVPGGPAATGRAEQAAGDPGGLTVTSAATPDYPTDTFALTMCLDGSASIMEVGDQVEFSPAGGAHVADVFFNDDGSCSGTPDESLSFTVADGDDGQLVIGMSGVFYYALDESCMEAGTGRVQFNNGIAFPQKADYYAVSEETGDFVPLSADVLPGSTVLVPNVPAAPYVIRAYAPGTPSPETTAPLAIIGTFDLQAGYQSQVFAAGSNTNDNMFGTFQLDQGPFVCAEEPEPTTSTTTSTTVVTTTTAAVAPATATPATPVSGTAAYTG